VVVEGLAQLLSGIPLIGSKLFGIKDFSLPLRAREGKEENIKE
jgi:hypothetical protein